MRGGPHNPHKDGKFRIMTKRRKVVDAEFRFPESFQYSQEQKCDLFDRLHAMAKEHLVFLARDGRGVKDFDHYLMEEVMSYLFGRNIFKDIEDIRAGWKAENV